MGAACADSAKNNTFNKINTIFVKYYVLFLILKKNKLNIAEIQIFKKPLTRI